MALFECAGSPGGMFRPHLEPEVMQAMITNLGLGTGQGDAVYGRFAKPAPERPRKENPSHDDVTI